MKKRYEQFTGFILNISRYIQKIKNEEMTKLGLKGKQVHCLFVLYNLEEGANITKLAEICEEDKGAMSRTVKELETNKLIYIEDNKNQKYKNHLKLTEKGIEAAQFIDTKILQIMEEASIGLSNEDREILYSSLNLISNNLSLICNNYGGKND